MMGMGTPVSATAAFWQQARQLPHMNTFNMNNTSATAAGLQPHANHVTHQYSSHHHAPPSGAHDAKMAEKIVSELQVSI